MYPTDRCSESGLRVGPKAGVAGRAHHPPGPHIGRHPWIRQGGAKRALHLVGGGGADRAPSFRCQPTSSSYQRLHDLRPLRRQLLQIRSRQPSGCLSELLPDLEQPFDRITLVVVQQVHQPRRCGRPPQAHQPPGGVLVTALSGRSDSLVTGLDELRRWQQVQRLCVVRVANYSRPTTPVRHAPIVAEDDPQPTQGPGRSRVRANNGPVANCRKGVVNAVCGRAWATTGRDLTDDLAVWWGIASRADVRSLTMC